MAPLPHLVLSILVLCCSTSNGSFLGSIFTVESDQDMQILKQSKLPTECDSAADYALYFNKLDVSPYPLKEGSDFTADVVATGKREVELKTIELLIKIGFIKIPLYYEIPLDLKQVEEGKTMTLDQMYMAPKVPIPLKQNQVTIILLDQDSAIQYCGLTTVTLSTPPALKLGSSSVYHCEMNKEYPLILKSFKLERSAVNGMIQLLSEVQARLDVNIQSVEISGASQIESRIPLGLGCSQEQVCQMRVNLEFSGHLQEQRFLGLKMRSEEGEVLGCFYVETNLESMTYS